ncbi:acid-sensing ion channel 2-like [Patiria miniata]|uniref:Uncharacterized protein n=1 Tax=Patiria miniata TaxID=46514 RepID=A0A913ZUZ1_PATMI|nr:acid-sensing ion channel 2-like [Patiria miniata]
MDYCDYEADGDAAAAPKRVFTEQTSLNEGVRPAAADEDGDVPNNWRRKNTVWRIERKKEHLFHQFMENTTLHGVKYVTNPAHSKQRRLIWMVLFVIMLVIVSCAIFSHFQEYFAYATKTVITYKTPHKTSFPSVVICNCNKFRISALNGSQWEELLPMVNTNGVYYSEQIEKLKAGKYFNVNAEEELRIKGANYRELGLALSHEFEGMLLDCRWAGRYRCSAANFTQVWTDFGVCYVFNGQDTTRVDDDGEGLMADNTGLDGGLWVRLNVEQSEHASSNTGSCFKVAIQPRGDVYFVRDAGRTVQPGYHSIIGLKKQVRKSMESPYDTHCRKDGLKYYNGYSINACRMECLTNDTMEKCGCIAPFMPESSGFPYCDLITLITCVAHRIGFPYCECNTPCSEILYDERVSYSQAPSIDSNKEVQMLFNWSKEEVSENILEISIYFEDLREQWTIQEAAYGLTALMSSIGGELGLCLGGSIITVFEFADYLLTRQALHFRLFKRKFSNVGRLKRRDHPV